MTIKSIFAKTRTEIRAAKAEHGGKIVDNGSTAESGERWELQIEVTASELVSEVLNDIDDLVDVPVREVLSMPMVDNRHIRTRDFNLKDRKGHPVRVSVKRSRTAAFLAANLARI